MGKVRMRCVVVTLALILTIACASSEAELSDRDHFGFKAPGDQHVTSNAAYAKSLTVQATKAAKAKLQNNPKAKVKGTKAKVKKTLLRALKKGDPKVKKLVRQLKKGGAVAAKALKKVAKKKGGAVAKALKKVAQKKGLVRKMNQHGKCGTKLKTMQHALQLCRSGIMQITEKSKRAHARIMKLAMRQQHQKLDSMQNRLEGEKARLARHEAADSLRLTKTVDAIRSAAKKTAKKDGKARLLAANQAKTEAKLALKKAIQFR